MIAQPSPFVFSFGATGPTAPAWKPDALPWIVNIQAGAVATVQLERSVDAGATWQVITNNSGGAPVQIHQWQLTALLSVSEDIPPAKFGVLYRLNCTSYTSGTIAGRFTQ